MNNFQWRTFVWMNVNNCHPEDVDDINEKVSGKFVFSKSGVIARRIKGWWMITHKYQFILTE